jgi:shikimate dehydrogenase
MTPFRRAAVLGRPIEHSLSPVLHRAAYQALGLDWEYDAVDCGVEELPATLDRLAADHAGLSLTMPLKTAALALLDEIGPQAETVGAVNTVLYGGSRNSARRSRRGENTDVAGVLAALDELGASESLADGAAVVVLGGGGAARAVLAALSERGVRSVSMLLRDVAKGAPLVALGERLGVAVAVDDWLTSAAAVTAADLVISTTPALAEESLPLMEWSPDAALFDLAYAPWPTSVARLALSAGAEVVGGLSMLVAQAAEQVRLMTGCEPPVDAMRAAGEAALSA